MSVLTRILIGLPIIVLMAMNLTFAQYWNGTPPQIGLDGTNGEVWDIAVIGSDTYVVGSFTEVGPGQFGGTVSATGIARWTGSYWESVDAPAIASGSRVRAITEFQGNIVIAGNILTDGDDGAVLMLQGNNWVALDDEPEWHMTQAGTHPGQVFKLLVNGSSLYVGGAFKRDGCKFVCEFSGGGWNQVGGVIGDVPDRVYDLIFHAGELYAAGDFPGGVARRSGSSWLPMGDGFFTQNVYSLELMNGELYAGGNFGISVPGNSYNRLARWDAIAGEWRQVFPVPNVNIWELRTMQCDGEQSLYAFGAFTNPGEHAADYGDGTGTATELDGGIGISGATAPVRVATCTSPDCNQGLLVGGEFISAGANSAGNLAEYLLPPDCGIQYSDVVTTTVDGYADDGYCSLREAIRTANTDAPYIESDGECAPGNGTDVIRFDPALADGTHELNNPSLASIPLQISSDMIIEGFSRDTLRIRGNAATPAFEVYPGVSLEIRTIGLEGQPDIPALITGAPGSLIKLDDVYVRPTNFSTPASTGAMFWLTEAELSVRNTDIMGSRGRIIRSADSVVEFDNSTLVSNNSGGDTVPLLDLHDSSLKFHQSRFNWNSGSATMISVAGGALEITQSTLAHNFFRELTSHLVDSVSSHVVIENSTFSRNASYSEMETATISVFDPTSNSRITSNTIVMNGNARWHQDNMQLLLGDVTGVNTLLMANNLIWTHSSANQYNTDCRLYSSSPTAIDWLANFTRGTSGGCLGLQSVNNPRIDMTLQFNGGPTETHLVRHNSVLLDSGSTAGCPAIDQRGLPRPTNGIECDVGAFERQ